ncbi:MAG: type II secretion system protein [Candidatus Omnitrophota bacterium]
MKSRQKKSMTLVEVLVSAVILATVFAGLFASFISARKYVSRANKRIVSSSLARSVFGFLHPQVSATNWADNTNALFEPNNTNWEAHDITDANITPNLKVDEMNFNGSYQVRVKNYITPGGPVKSEYREVLVNFTYQ